MDAIIVPIFICVVLPVAIVAIVYGAAINSDNKRAKVLIKAIESCGIDADRLAEALRQPKKTPRELLNLRLLRGCIFSIMGLGFVILGILSICMKSTPAFAPDVFPVCCLLACPFLAVGIGYLIVYFVSRKQL